MNFVTYNPTADIRTLSYLTFNGERNYYKALKNYFEGIGGTVKVIVKSQ